MVNYNVLPHVSIHGKISNNNLNVRYSKKRHTPYLMVVIYVQSSNSAIIIPVVAFKKNALTISKYAHQGDRVTIQAMIEVHYNHGFFNPSLIVRGWSFNESRIVRQRKHKLAPIDYFPYVPENCPVHHFNHRKHKQNTSKGGSLVAVTSGSASSTSNKASKAIKSHKDVTKDAPDWIDEVETLTEYNFPRMQ